MRSTSTGTSRVTIFSTSTIFTFSTCVEHTNVHTHELARRSRHTQAPAICVCARQHVGKICCRAAPPSPAKERDSQASSKSKKVRGEQQVHAQLPHMQNAGPHRACRHTRFSPGRHTRFFPVQHRQREPRRSARSNSACSRRFPHDSNDSEAFSTCNIRPLTTGTGRS
jgi:hypothetical protein